MMRATRSRWRCHRIGPEYDYIRRRTEVQAFPVWTPPGGTLGGIVAEARERADVLRERQSELEDLAGTVVAVPAFAASLKRANVAVIAEVKRRSPSKGWINAAISAPDQAAAYEA